MDGTAPAGTTPQPAGHDEVAPRLAIVLNGHSGSRPACRVEAPDRVLRMWTLLNTADDELHQAKLPPGAATRLERQLRAVTTELERSVSRCSPMSCTTSSARARTHHRPWPSCG
jgi:hypothetical protein